VLRRLLVLTSVAMVLVACSGGDPSEDEDTGDVAEPLTARCKVNVRGVGTLDVETDYLPNVVHCENGGAPYEALKAQAIAARTFLYYKLETSGSIADGQSDQVYSCGSKATALQKKAVQETAGIVLRYGGTTLCSFFVAGGSASAPSCHGGSASTEHYVTYNAGLSGSAIHQSSLGWVSPSNKRNRGCLSQLGSRCLANEGKKYDDILHFYYGKDVALEHAAGACVPDPPAPAPKPAPTATTPKPAPTPTTTATTPKPPPAPTSTTPQGKDAGPPGDAGDDDTTDPEAGVPTTPPVADGTDDPGADPDPAPPAQETMASMRRSARAVPQAGSCSASPGATSPAPAWLLVVAGLLARRRRTRSA
jgi:MYXO-CTERM domain-containing protein